MESGRSWRGACILVALTTLGLVAQPARAADRVVIAEEFTSTSCGYCVYAGLALDMLLDEFPDTFTLVQYHINDSYATTWATSRASFYGVSGTPVAWFDGTLQCAGAYTNTQQQYNWYLSQFNARKAVPTDVTITATGVPVSGQTYTLRARVCLEAGGTAKTVRVYMVQVLDNWPTSPAYSRNGFKQAATYQDVALTPGTCQTVARNFTFDSTSWANQNDIRFIVWAQEPQSYSSTSNPAEIYQTKVLPWPFPADCNFNGRPDDEDLNSGDSQDCNANHVPDECDIAGGSSVDTNTNGVPDECEIVVGDANCDGLLNFRDINPFVLLVSNWTEWHAAFPDCPTGNGDINRDGGVTFADINPFVVLLTSQ